MSGILFVLSAPSGCGKTTLERALVANDSTLCASVSYTTRAMRPKEVDGQDYFFVDETTFSAMIAADEFIEYARVFNNFYGSAWKTLRSFFEQGRDVLLVIDTQGAMHIIKRFPEAVLIFVMPSTLGVLKERLVSRGSGESNAELALRLANARGEMRMMRYYQYCVVNERFEVALKQLQGIISVEREIRLN